MAMNRYRFLGLAAYLVATTLIVVPFFDAAMSLWPWQPGSARWRFGAVGLGSNALMVPCAGVLIALATSITLGHLRAARLLGIVCALGAFFTTLAILLFALDAMQTRADVNPAALLSFNVASLTAVVKLMLGTATLAAFARAGIRSSNERRVATAQPSVRQPLATNDAAGR